MSEIDDELRPDTDTHPLMDDDAMGEGESVPSEEDLEESDEPESEDLEATGGMGSDPDQPADTVSSPNETRANSDLQTPEEEPYKFDQCTITLLIQLLPDDGVEGGRPVVLGIRDHDNAPILRYVKGDELQGLTAIPVINELIQRLITDLPRRHLAHLEKQQKIQANAAKRAEKVNARTNLQTSSSTSSVTKPAPVAKPPQPEKPKPSANQMSMFDF